MKQIIILLALSILASVIAFGQELVSCPDFVDCCNEPYYTAKECQTGFNCANHICRENNPETMCGSCTEDSECDNDLFCYNSRCQPYQYSSNCTICWTPQYSQCMGVVSEKAVCNPSGYGYDITEKYCVDGCDSLSGMCMEDLTAPKFDIKLLLIGIGVTILLMLIWRRN